jgi:hypothetical protein
MPLDPTLLPWWGWLASMLVLLLLARMAWESSVDHEKAGCGFAALLLLLAFLAGVIGFVRFVKWAWNA